MKSSIWLLCLLLAFVWPLQSMAATSNWNTDNNLTCSPNKNPFLPFLKSHGVSILPTPVNTVKKCGQEWSKFGTCCDYPSVAQYLFKEAGLLKKSLDTFATDIELLINNTDSHSDLLLKKLEAIASSANSKYNLTKTKIAVLLYSTNLMKNNIEDFKIQQKLCLQKLGQVRSSSVCSTCSGRSEAFFRDGKATLGIKDCKKIIDKCHEYWSKLIWLTGEVKSMAKTIKIIREIHEAASLVFQGNDHNYLINWIKEHQLEERLKTCTSVTSCPDATATELCSSLISIKEHDPLTLTTLENLQSHVHDSSSLASVVIPASPSKLRLLLSTISGKRQLTAIQALPIHPPIGSSVAPVQSFMSFSDICISPALVTNFDTTVPASTIMDLSFQLP